MSKSEYNMKDYDPNADNCILLGRIIQKAKKNGYIHKYKFSVGFMINCDHAEVYKMIFSHNFAKAFWGEWKETYYEEWRDSSGYLEGNEGYQSTWQHHLQQMILVKEPLKYLEKFL